MQKKYFVYLYILKGGWPLYGTVLSSAVFTIDTYSYAGNETYVYSIKQ